MLQKYVVVYSEVLFYDSQKMFFLFRIIHIYIISTPLFYCILLCSSMNKDYLFNVMKKKKNLFLFICLLFVCSSYLLLFFSFINSISLFYLFLFKFSPKFLNFFSNFIRLKKNILQLYCSSCSVIFSILT